MPRYNPLLSQLQTYPAVAIDQLKAEVAASGKRVFDFGVGDPVEPTAEFIRQACLGALEPVCGYPSVKGRASFRNTVSDYLRRRFGVTVDPATQVLPVAGSKEAVFHLPLLVVDPKADDNLVVFPDPGYPAYERGALFSGATPYAAILDGDYRFRPWELPTDVLERTRMLWINNPHNPSGAVSPLEDLQRVGELCRDYDILCVSDETYADIYDPTVAAPPHSILEVGMPGLLALHSLSKRSGMTGYRTGFIAGDADTIGQLATLRTNPGLAPQDFINAAAEAAWADDTHVAERRDVFNAKRALFLKFFREVGIEVVASEATIYLWLKVPPGFTDETYSMHLVQAGIVAGPGRIYGVAGGGVGHVRLAMVPSLEEIREAIEVWRTLI